MIGTASNGLEAAVCVHSVVTDFGKRSASCERTSGGTTPARPLVCTVQLRGYRWMIRAYGTPRPASPVVVRRMPIISSARIVITDDSPAGSTTRRAVNTPSRSKPHQAPMLAQMAESASA